MDGVYNCPKFCRAIIIRANSGERFLVFWSGEVSRTFQIQTPKGTYLRFNVAAPVRNQIW